MPILPYELPRTLTVSVTERIMAGTLAYCQISDVPKSRLIERSLGRELNRLMRKDPQLRKKLERVMDKYDYRPKSTRNHDRK